MRTLIINLDFEVNIIKNYQSIIDENMGDFIEKLKKLEIKYQITSLLTDTIKEIISKNHVNYVNTLSRLPQDDEKNKKCNHSSKKQKYHHQWNLLPKKILITAVVQNSADYHRIMISGGNCVFTKPCN